jgi:integrase
VLAEPKSQAGRRAIALPAPLVSARRSDRAAQGAETLAAGTLWAADGDYMFAQVNGKPIDPWQDHAAWKQLCADAGVRQARLHDARHTAATLLLQQGVAPRVAMQILGQSQISLTLGTYSHVVPELATDTAEKMGAALWGNGYRNGTWKEAR